MTKETSPPLQILVVEDEPTVRLFLQRSLNDLGHEVIGLVDNADECLKVAVAARPDLVFMDIHINGREDGIDAADRLNREIGSPVIFLTANADIETVERAAKTKPYGYIVKPFTQDDLRVAITVAMSRVTIDKAGTESIDLGAGYSYSQNQRTLKYDNEAITLPKKEMLLLHILITNMGRTVAYEEISEFVWRLDEASNANALRDLLYRVRKRLPEHKIVSTPGVGVQLKPLA